MAAVSAALYLSVHMVVSRDPLCGEYETADREIDSTGGRRKAALHSLVDTSARPPLQRFEENS